MRSASAAISGLVRLLGRLLLSGGLLLWSLCAVSLAQITLDGSLGPRGALPGPHYRIPAEVGQIRGPNLFQSFGEVNVPTQGSATFTGPQTITNILSRVTGGKVSHIDGTLRSEIAGANLYLLNPSGVLFGPHASLDVSGSFHVSTADYLRLADGARFGARLSNTSTLSVAPPIAFGFLSANPAAITIQGSSLKVADGKTFSVVGGDITIVGQGPLTEASVPTEESVPTLGAPGGRIQLVSVVSPGEVVFSPIERVPALQVDAFICLGRVELSRGAFLNAAGNGGGTVVIRGGRLLVDNAFIFTDNLGNRDGAGLGLDLQITADALFTHDAVLTADSLGAGRARDVWLRAGNVYLEHGAQISSGTIGPGQSGLVRITATDTLTLSGTSADGLSPSGLFVDAVGTGVGAGNAGGIVVEAPRLTLTGGAQIQSATFGSGQGGTIRARATDTLTFAGTRPDGAPSGMNADARGTDIGAGDAGAVVVEARTVQIAEGAQMSSNTLGPGHGGTVMVTTADALTITGRNSGFRTTASGSGRGGDITVDAHKVQLTDGAAITAESTGAGNAGRLTLTARDTVQIQGHSAVTTAANEATGGNIRVTAPALVRLQDSQITATVGGRTGDGGNVTIDPDFIVLQGSQVTANAFAGHGGRVTLTASKALLADPGSAVTASSTRGINGEVNIQAPITNISGTLVPLPQVFARAITLVSSRCAERLRAGTVSTLVLRGRDGVPARPGRVLSLPLALARPETAEAGGTAGPPEDTAASRVGVLQVDEHGQAQVRGWPGQGVVPAGLALECAK